MKKTNIFDDVMNYIDEHIKENYSEIKRGIYAVSNYSDMEFSKFLSILTSGKCSLKEYFVRRKLFYISKELVDNKEKSIVNIALEYGYSEQSALNRAIKKQYNCTPNEIRKNDLRFNDERLHFSDFSPCINKYGNRLQDAINSFIRDDCFIEDADYFETFINATDEYGFDTATCLAVSEISERIGVPFGMLLNICFETMISIRSDENYLDPKIEKAIDCGITSTEELNAICDYYNCNYYQLNTFMVNEYRKKNSICSENRT